MYMYKKNKKKVLKKYNYAYICIICWLQWFTTQLYVCTYYVHESIANYKSLLKLLVCLSQLSI